MSSVVRKSANPITFGLIATLEAKVTGCGEVFLHIDSRWGFRVRASDGAIIAVDGGPGYETKAEARETLERLLRGDFNGPIEATAESG